MNLRAAAGATLLLASAAAAALWPDSLTVGHARARRELADPIRLGPEQGEGWRSGDRVMLEFAGWGFAGPIEGHVVIGRAASPLSSTSGGTSGESRHPPTIESVVLTRSREGVDGDALDAAHRARYVGLPVDHPVAVDAITGATISSVALRDAVNEVTTRWMTSARQNLQDPSEEAAP